MGSNRVAMKESNTAGTAAVSFSIADAKAHFSEVVSTVEMRRQPVTILRRGRAVARLVPVEDQKPSLYGSMRGTVVELADITAPTGGEWSVGGE